MPSITRSVFIACSCERIFAYLADMSNMRAFMSGISDLEVLSEDPAAPDAEAMVWFSVGPLALRSRIKRTVFNPHRRIAHESLEGVRNAGNIVLEPCEEPVGTNVIYEMEYALPPGGFLIRGMAGWQVETHLGRTLENLKRILEADSD